LDESRPDLKQWDVEQTIELAKIVADKGVDVIDVSTGGVHSDQHPHSGPSYQAPFAKKIKDALGDKLIVGTVGMITEGKQAQGLLDEGLDIIVVGRAFLKNPGLVFSWGDELGVDVNMPNQIRWGFSGRGKKGGGDKS
ncbi:MAG: hypothetical protein INR71_14170, partial [Terriglobus roseus]|nr:hypothetical protein [Terriglobus roseus]